MRRKTTPPPAALPPHGERDLKLQLAVEVNRVLQGLHLTQEEAAERLKILQPHVSELARYRLERFSVERLIQFFALLGNEVEIRIRRGTSRSPRVAPRRIVVR